MSSSRTHIGARSKRARRGREGAVMLVVMLVVLMVTATGLFAVYSTTYELRSAGTFRQAMQTQYIAEGGVATGMALIDVMGAGSIDLAMQRVPVPAGRQFTREEPAYAQSTPHFRVYRDDFPTLPSVVAQPVEWDPAAASASGGTSLGSTLAYQPNYTIDMDDSFRPGRPIAGMSVTGESPVSYRVWTITSRGRTGLPTTGPSATSDVFAPGETAYAAQLQRGNHEAAMNARAVVLSGPM
jgi:hypothetical protein